MRRLNLRLRTTAAISIVCLAIVAMLGGTLYTASERMELALVEQLVAEELDFLVQRYQADPAYVPTPGPNVDYYILRPGEQAANQPDFMRDLGAGHYEIDIGEGRGERDVVIRQVGDTRFVVVYNIGPYEQREQEFKHLVVVSLLIVMGLAVVLGYLLSGFLTKQLTLLTQKVGKLQPGQPYESLLRDEQDAEVAMLAGAFDQYHRLFLQMIRREQEFTANVSHELRTPLTAIRTSCELLLQDALPEKALTRVRHIMQAATAMSAHAQALLLLARQREFGQREEIAIGECVDDVLANFRDEIARKGLACEVDIPPEARVNTNRQALQVVLGNLLGNAVAYTSAGFVRVKLEADRLVVADSGAGIPGEHLPFIFERRYRGRGQSEGRGLGLGLDIVRRICEQTGWTIEAHSVLGKGSRFTLGFGTDLGACGP